MTNQKRSFYFLIPLFIGALLFIISSSVAFAETEPNDTFATADDIGIGYINADTNASISVGGDLDYYKFNAEAGNTYVIETFNVQGNGSAATGIWLYDSSESQLASDRYGSDGTGNADARITFTFSQSGTYFILVKDSDLAGVWNGNYSLRVLPKYDEPGAGWDPDNDFEPNDALVLANEIQVGFTNAQQHTLATYSNIVTNDTDYDFYRFTGEEGNTYVIETFNIQGNGSAATGLWLFDNTGALLANDRYGADGTGNADARITFTFSQTGTYFILIKDSDLAGIWNGTYSLQILPKYNEPDAGWDPDNDFEPNDELVLAYEIQAGFTNAQQHTLATYPNIITNDSDYDFYRFTTEESQTYVIETFNIQGNGSAATGIWLFNSSGALLANDRYGSNGTGNADARITFTFSQAETYFILVKDSDLAGVWAGDYSLRILPEDDEHCYPWNSEDDSEPNDVLVLACEIQTGSANAQEHILAAYPNLITNTGDYDFYRFNAEMGNTYIMETFDIQGGAAAATGMWLFDGSGTQLAHDRYGSNGTGNIDAKITFTFSQAGTYFILVKDSDLSGVWTGNYSLQVCEDDCSEKLFLPIISN